MKRLSESIFNSGIERNQGTATKKEDKEFIEKIQPFIDNHKLQKEDYRIDVVNHSVDFMKTIKIGKEDLVDGKLPFQFGKVEGNFYTSDLGLTTLENSPKEVTGTFVIYDNRFTRTSGGT